MPYPIPRQTGLEFARLAGLDAVDGLGRMNKLGWTCRLELVAESQAQESGFLTFAILSLTRAGAHAGGVAAVECKSSFSRGRGWGTCASAHQHREFPESRSAGVLPRQSACPLGQRVGLSAVWGRK